MAKANIKKPEFILLHPHDKIFKENPRLWECQYRYNSSLILKYQIASSNYIQSSYADLMICHRSTVTRQCTNVPCESLTKGFCPNDESLTGAKTFNCKNLQANLLIELEDIYLGRFFGITDLFSCLLNGNMQYGNKSLKDFISPDCNALSSLNSTYNEKKEAKKLLRSKLNQLIAEEFATACKTNQISITKMADFLHVTDRSVSNYKKGTQALRPYQIEALYVYQDIDLLTPLFM